MQNYIILVPVTASRKGNRGLMKRRRFLNFLLTILGLTAAGSFAYTLVRYMAPAGQKAKSKQITLKKSEIPVGDAKDIALNGTPTMVINRPGMGFIALSRVCTHLGCLVDYNQSQKRIICPCHGAIFDLEGNVLSGPPPRPLPKFPLKVEGESIVIG
jgi:cytochrome b6-f complex iron-sulfur subunit